MKTGFVVFAERNGVERTFTYFDDFVKANEFFADIIRKECKKYNDAWILDDDEAMLTSYLYRGFYSTPNDEFSVSGGKEIR